MSYISPASRIMLAEELNGIQRTVTFIMEAANAGLTEMVDLLDQDVIARRYQDLTGAPADILKSGDVVKKIREARAEAQQQAAELEQQKAQAEIARSMGQAAQAGSIAQNNAANPQEETFGG